jgi:hypothetical protein
MRVGEEGALDEPVEEQPAVARAAAVEAEGELVEVAVEVLVADGALVALSAGLRANIRPPWGSGVFS